MKWFIIIVAGIFLYGIFHKVSKGGFSKCEKCGSRLTMLEDDALPLRYRHARWERPRIELHCIHCGHVEVISGSPNTRHDDL